MVFIETQGIMMVKKTLRKNDGSYGSEYGWRLFAFILFFQITHGVHSTEYSIDYSLSEKVEYESNPRLESDGEDLSGYMTSPVMRAKALAETYEYGIGIDLVFSRFSKQEFNTDDQFVDLFYNKSYEKGRVGVSGSWANRSARTSEILDVKVIDITERRETANLSLNGGYQFNEKNRLQLSTGYNDVKNESDVNGDNDSVRGSLLWRRKYNERFSFQVNMVANDYNTEKKIDGLLGVPGRLAGVENESSSLGVQVGFMYMPSESASVSLLVGETEVDIAQRIIDVPTGILLNRNDQSNKSNLLNFTADYQFNEKTSLRSDVTQEVSVSGDGFVQESNGLVFGGDYNVSSRLRSFTEITFEKRDALSVNVNSSDREDLTFKVGASYRLLENLLLKSVYRYRETDFGNEDDRARSSQVDFSLVYEPGPIVWSR